MPLLNAPRRPLRTALVAGMSVVALLAGPSAFAEPPDDVAAGLDLATIDTQDRAAVAAAYLDTYQPAAAVAAPEAAPEADPPTCQAGTAPDDLQQATLNLVNYVRAMSGVDAVTFDSGLSAKAQQAALMMYANDALDHEPPSDWACYSADGVEAAGQSNLALGANGAGVVRTYMDDAGSTNSAAGHRYWLQRPAAETMGSGFVGSANALWVVGNEPPASAPAYTSWPSAGYFPNPLEPNGRWSFTAWQPGFDLSEATVTVTSGAGTPVPAMAYPLGSLGSLVFELGNLPDPTGLAASDYTVTVTNILVDGIATSHSYAVRLFDPTAEQFTALAPPIISGTARVGSTLTAQAPVWSQAGVTTGYQWLRNGQPISGATSTQYKLVAADADTTIAVRATGAKSGYAAVPTSSAATGKVTKIPASVSVRGSSSRVGNLSLTITVSAPGESVPDGTVWVKQGTTVLRAKLPLTGGRATFTATGIKPGRYTYSAGYGGTSRIAAATGSTAVSIKSKARPTIRISPKVAPARVTLGIAVTATGQPPLGGTAFVTEGSKTLKSGIKITKGKATFSATPKPGTHTYRVGYNGTTQVSTGSATVTVKVPAPVKLVSYTNCAAMQKVHPHGVGRTGAKDSTSGKPVTTFLVHTKLYAYNDGKAARKPGEKDLDRDNDGIACEKA